MNSKKTLYDGYVTAYKEQCRQFAKTTVIKFSELADLMNESIIATYGDDAVDRFQPETWRYYMNMAGQYHPTDVMMTVTSIDTLTPIEFTVENLQIHTATKKAYTYGSRYYRSLLLKYPEQEALICGILNPVNIQHAIEAESGTILGWEPSLVEPQEITLIEDLEVWVKNQFERWNNVQFAMSDNLYCTSFLTMLQMFIMAKLMNLRTARCKTPEAHSFHIRMYLASHHGLDRYMPYMTLKQQLWFYRNILYIERNYGKIHQFMTLIERVLTERGIPVGEYTVRQLDDFFPNYAPVLQARMRLINDDQNSLNVDFHPVEELFLKEYPLAPGNQLWYETYTSRDFERFQDHNTAVTKTKDLVSSMVDYSNAVPEPFEVVAIREWCHLASIGFYDVAVNFQDIKTTEARTLFAEDAFIYMTYLSLMAEGIQIDTVPRYLNMQFRRHPKPSKEDLLSVMDYERRDLSHIVDLVWGQQPNIAPMFSVTSFFNHIQTQYNLAYWHWFLISSMHDMDDRAMVENMIRRLYADQIVEFTTETDDMAAWLASKNLPEYNLTHQEALLQVREIYENATGYQIDGTKQLRNIQKALVDLMTELSSYSIQFIREVNDSDIIPINWPAVRLGKIKPFQSEYRREDTAVEVLNLTALSELNVSYEVGADTWFQAHTAHYQQQFSVTVGTDVVTKTEAVSHYQDFAKADVVDVSYEGQDPELDRKVGAIGATLFENLDEAVKRTVKSKYQSSVFN